MAELTISRLLELCTDYTTSSALWEPGANRLVIYKGNGH